jgi:predicted nucleic acid-binding protein
MVALLGRLDRPACAIGRCAAELGIASSSRSLDALHMAAAERAGGRSMQVFTFDVRLAHAARSLGFTIVGE